MVNVKDGTVLKNILKDSHIRTDRVIMKTSITDRLLVLLVLAGAMAAVYYGNIAYQSSLGRAVLARSGMTSLPLNVAEIKARNESRQGLVEVAAIWCPTCRTLDQYVFSDPEVQEFISKRYLFSRIEYDSPEGAAFLADSRATGYQGLWIIDGNGHILRRLPIVLSAERFLAEIP